MLHVCVPAYQSHIWLEFMESCLLLQEDLLRNGIDFDFNFNGKDSLVPRARNVLVSSSLQAGADRILFIDSDIQFTPMDVAKLWNMDVPISCAAYPMKKKGEPASAWVKGEIVDLDSLDGVVEADYAGTGFMMIKREVFETLKPGLWHREGQVGDCWAFFNGEVVRDGEDAVYLSEDYNFCRLAREAGYKIHLDPSIRLIHWGNYPYGE